MLLVAQTNSITALQTSSKDADEGLTIPPHVRVALYLMDAWMSVKDSTIRFYLIYIVFTWLGNFVSPFFFCFHLLDIINRSPTLQVWHCVLLSATGCTTECTIDVL